MKLLQVLEKCTLSDAYLTKAVSDINRKQR